MPSSDINLSAGSHARCVGVDNEAGEGLAGWALWVGVRPEMAQT